MTRVEFPPQTPEERAGGDAWWAAFDRAQAIYHTHKADQFLAQLHAAIEAGVALGSQCVCGASDCQFSRSGEESK